MAPVAAPAKSSIRIAGMKSPTVMTCTECALSVDESRLLHERLSSLHPDGDPVQAALAAADAGRYVLALKLSSASLAWQHEVEMARAIRLQALEAMDQYDAALDEAWTWAQEPKPPNFVWGIIADLEASTGNIPGAMQALERGLRDDPNNVEMWTDYSELLCHVDRRTQAIEAASYGVDVDHLRPRCIEVLSTLAQKYYDESQYIEALSACTHAGNWQEYSEIIAWIRACIAARQEQDEVAIKWLKVVLRLNPDRADAQSALDQLVPPPKKGFFRWLTG